MEYKSNGIMVNGKFTSLTEITEKVNKARIAEDKLGLMTLSWPMTRSFDGATEQFVAPIKNLYRIKEIIGGKFIYFGEIAGKHSEVCGDLKLDEITINEDVMVVNKFLVTHPNGRDYDHSFLDTFHNSSYDEEYDKTSKEEFEQLVYPND